MTYNPRWPTDFVALKVAQTNVKGPALLPPCPQQPAQPKCSQLFMYSCDKLENNNGQLCQHAPVFTPGLEARDTGTRPTCPYLNTGSPRS